MLSYFNPTFDHFTQLATAAALASIISPHSPTHLPTLHTSWQQKSSTGRSNLLHTQCDENRDVQTHNWYQPQLEFSLQAGQDWVSIEVISEVQWTPYHDLSAATHLCIPSNLFNDIPSIVVLFVNQLPSRKMLTLS